MPLSRKSYYLFWGIGIVLVFAACRENNQCKRPLSKLLKTQKAVLFKPDFSLDDSLFSRHFIETTGLSPEKVAWVKIPQANHDTCYTRLVYAESLYSDAVTYKIPLKLHFGPNGELLFEGKSVYGQQQYLRQLQTALIDQVYPRDYLHILQPQNQPHDSVITALQWAKKHYADIYRKGALRLFGKTLCSLTESQVDSLQSHIPYKPALNYMLLPSPPPPPTDSK